MPYLAVYEGYYSSPTTNHLVGDIDFSDTFRFETMGRIFWGRILTINQKTAEVDSLFDLWGYQVEASETLTLLWPPAVQKNEISTMDSEYAFLFSSFNLEPHGNINVHSTDIKSIGSGVSRVSVNSRVKIYRKNAEITINSERREPSEHDILPLRTRSASVYKVPDDSTYFLFNRSGAAQIREGQTVSLTPGSLIKHYRFGYLDGIISPVCQNRLSGEPLLNDLLAHYKQTEHFSGEAFESLELSEIATRYIGNCRETGVINTAAKRFIEEGRL
jgi:hypothetical protein